MNENQYHKTIAALEKDGVARGYIHGWASGFLGNPKMEEQRVTEAYKAGYADGVARCTEHAKDWKDTD